MLIFGGDIGGKCPNISRYNILRWNILRKLQNRPLEHPKGEQTSMSDRQDYLTLGAQ